MEMEAPIRVHRVALRKDSGGAGTFRGGLGVVREYEILDGEVSLSHRGERHFFSAPGLDGGSEGARAHSVIRRAGGGEEVIPSKTVTTLHKGDRLVIETAGGGGYGDPHARTAEQVRDDVRNGKISEEAARAAYGLIAGHRHPE
jgi:N-methylhydantoinase B